MVSVADFGFCFSHRWLVSPESQLHGFPLITPYSADLFTIVSIGPMSTTCILFHWLPHEFVIHAYCTSPSFWGRFGIYGGSCASYPQYHPTSFHSFDLLGWIFEPCISSFPWP